MPEPLPTDEIRRRFIAFFVSKGHKHLSADSLVPANDKSVLFTGAGMNQFKDHFLGRAKLDHPQQRAVTVQPCVRTADIENVGRTPNHHACFEMLGNFSFGDYFKNEAVQWAAEFILDPKTGLGLEKERISVTVYGGNAKLGIQKDEEAIAAWKKHAPWLQDPKAPGGWRIYEYGDHDNYWPADAPEQGPNGPSGPCSEIYYDTKPEQGAPEPVADSKDKDRYCEFWNLVFTQYNRVGVGKLEPLKNKNIDTGSGLERVARLLQDKPNNYEIDLLFPVVKAVSKLCGKEYGKDFEQDRRMRRITDHVRFAVFAIADGVKPGRNEREYVLRRLLRRAILDGKELGINDLFLNLIAWELIQKMGVGYPDFHKKTEAVFGILQSEEIAFNKTLVSGQERIDSMLMTITWHQLTKTGNKDLISIFPIAHKSIENSTIRLMTLDDGTPNFGSFSANEAIAEWHRNKHKLNKVDHNINLDGALAFEFWDTFGFPLELTEEICQRYEIKVNKSDFEHSKNKAVEQSKKGSTIQTEIFASGPVQELKAKYAGKLTVFEGYGKTVFDGAKVLAIVHDGKVVERAEAGQALVLLDRTPFYAESGGQVSDKGRIVVQLPSSITGAVDDMPTTRKGLDCISHNVTDMKKDGGLFFHVVELGGALKAGDTVTAFVEDEGHRRPTQRSHSATHLLHLALRRILGVHVEQRGSLVEPDRLRFDFTHFEAIDNDQAEKIENFINHLVRSDLPVETFEKPIAEAKAMGAMALFGEKYGDRVRVVQIGQSIELCGGTHVSRTGEIGFIRLTNEGSISSGIRRIEALTGVNAVKHVRHVDQNLADVATLLKTSPDAIWTRIKALQDEKAALERELDSFKKKAANAAAGDLLAQVREVNGAKFLSAALDGLDAPALRTTLDGIRKKLPEGAVVLAGNKDGKVALLVSLSPDLVKRGGHAGNILKEIAPLVGGKGGGKPEMAQGGGQDFVKAPEALKKAEEVLAGMLKG